MPAITAATRASSAGRSQKPSATTIRPTSTAPDKTSRELLENIAAANNKIAKPHSTLLNAQNVTCPTSSATGKERDAAWNFTGVARNETPASMPAQNAAANAVAAIRDRGLRTGSVIPPLQRLAARGGRTSPASGSAQSFQPGR